MVRKDEIGFFHLFHFFRPLASERILCKCDSDAPSRRIFHSAGIFHRFGNNVQFVSFSCFSGKRLALEARGFLRVLLKADVKAFF